MKNKILILLALLPMSALAQKFEVSLGTGLSINSKPTNNMFYRGDKVATNYSFNLTTVKNIDHKLQIGLETHVLQLSRITDHYFPVSTGHNVTYIGNDDKQFVYSKITTSLCALINKKVYTNHGFFYGGVAMGVGIARNFHKTTPSADANYIAPDGGYGPCFGAQVGYNYFFANRWALNVEIAARDFDLDYDAGSPYYKPYTNIHYRIVAYTSTLGFRYVFGFKGKQQPRGYTPEL